jgi:hypothetical protein
MASKSHSANTMLAVLFVFGTLQRADAEDRSSWFQSLRVPSTKASCCDVSDCQRTEADWRGGHWWAVVDKKWREIPNKSVLTHPVSIDGSAYVCAGSPTWSISGLGRDPPIYCFVPPNWPS